MTSTKTTERTEELLDELYDTLTRLVHYCNGMKSELAQKDYTVQMAERDFMAFTCNEGMSVVPILADLIDILDMQKASDQ